MWIYRREIATAIKKKRKLKTGVGKFSITEIIHGYSICFHVLY